MASELEQIQEAFSQIDEFTSDVADDLDTVVAHVDLLGQRLTEALADKEVAVREAVESSLRTVRESLTQRAEALRAVALKVETPVPPPLDPIDEPEVEGTGTETPNVGVEPSTGAQPGNVDGK